MGVKVYYAEISGHKEVKKHQQRVMMILDSKQIPYDAIDITEAGKEAAKDFMLANAKPKGDSKSILSPQVFNDEVYCGDYDDFDMANENDALEEFLHTEKVSLSNGGAPTTNGGRASLDGLNAQSVPTGQSEDPALTTNDVKPEDDSGVDAAAKAQAEARESTTAEDNSIPDKSKGENVPEHTEDAE